jgi:enoyl-CoA hydratase/carnithine racemase
MLDTEGTVTYELRAGVAWLGLNRTHKRNAIDEALLAGFEAAVHQEAQDEARALVVFGHGPCFSAGLDLAEHRAREPGEVFTTPVNGTRRSPCFVMGASRT